MPVRSCSAASKLRQATPKGATSLNRDHRALDPVLRKTSAEDAYQHQLKYESAQRKRQLDRPAYNGAIASPN
jgi:hypothetical protein